MSLRIYKKKLDYSYSFGIFPTIELLRLKPEKVTTVLLNDKTSNSEGIEIIKGLCKKHRINFDVSPKTIDKIARKENTQAIGVFNKYRQELDASEDTLVLVNPSDMGNVGTIIRTMVGFNVRNLALIRPAVDIFDPKVVRSSMGALSNVNYDYFETFNQYLDKNPSGNVYTFMLSGEKKLNKVEFVQPAILVFGNEGSGLPEGFKKYQSVKIDHSRNIDSLNLSTSVGISLYAFNNNR